MPLSCPIPINGRNWRIRAIWHYLAENGPSTSADMAAAMGIVQHTVTQSIMHLRATTGTWGMRICGWHRYTFDETHRAGGGRLAPIWTIGNGQPDMEKPARLPAKLANQMHYQRNKAVVLAKGEGVRRRKGVAPRDALNWLPGIRSTQMTPREEPPKRGRPRK